MSTTPSTPTRKSQWTDERREAARERANRMVKEGTFGGGPGRGGRPRKHAPIAQDLLRVLRAEKDQRHALLEGQREVLDSSRALAKLAHALDVDRDHLSQLLVMGTQQMVSDGQLAQMALIDVDEVRLFNPSSREQKKRLRDELEKLPRSSRITVPSDLTLADAKKFDDAELIECVVLIAVMTYRELLSGAIAAAILTETRKALPFAVAELERRTKLATSATG